MATTAVTLIQRTRRFMGDWPENDQTAASLTNAATSIQVADSTQYQQGFTIQIDTEAMYVSALADATHLTVRRAQRGTVGASHASGATILIRPHFFDVEYVDALNSGINAAFPLIYQQITDETTVTTAGTYEYAIPTMAALGVPIPFIWRLSAKVTGDLTFRQFSSWDLVRGAGSAVGPAIKMRRDLPPGKLRIEGFGPIEPLVDTTSSLNALFPVRAEDALTMYASQFLLASGEARRVREDTGARDDREQANRVGASMQAAASLLQRFQMRLMQTAMPPLPKNIKSVI